MPKQRIFIFDDEDNEVELNGRWEICSTCRGEGKSSAHLGAFSQDDMAEQGQEFMEDYMNGFYDVTCSKCDGGRVWVIDEERNTPEQVKLWYERVADNAEIDHMQEMERRMGA